MEDGRPRPFENTDEIFHKGVEPPIPLAPPEKDPGIPYRLGSCFMQQGYKAMANVGIVAQAIVGAHVGFPKSVKTWRLGSEAHNVVTVVLKNDSPTGSNRADQSADHGHRVGDMFEKEACVSQVE